MKFFLCFLVLMSVVMFILISHDLFSPRYPGSVASISDASGAVDDGKWIGTCQEQTLNSEVIVFKSPNVGENVGGDFTPSNPARIRLVDTSIKTIAHEASHLVDSLLQKRGITDFEVEAYLQGFYTQCIYNLL